MYLLSRVRSLLPTKRNPWTISSSNGPTLSSVIFWSLSFKQISIIFPFEKFLFNVIRKAPPLAQRSHGCNYVCETFGRRPWRVSIPVEEISTNAATLMHISWRTRLKTLPVLHKNSLQVRTSVGSSSLSFLSTKPSANSSFSKLCDDL